jgi:Raf kinase inhibitor-like YbhB/YbcL family protein
MGVSSINIRCFIALLAAAALGGCGDSEGRPTGPTKQGGATMGGIISVTSPAFDGGQRIPRQHTGEGADHSPALVWTGVPDGTASIALIVDDPDAPRDEPWVHWVIYDLPADCAGLPEAVPRNAVLTTPLSAKQGVNSWPSENIGYRGPMPPPGHGVHHYHFKVYALDKKLNLPARADKTAVVEAMEGLILAEGELVGIYERE